MSVTKTLMGLMHESPNMHVRQNLDDAARIAEYSTDAMPEYVAKIRGCLDRAEEHDPRLTEALVAVRAELQEYLDLASEPPCSCRKAVD